MANRKIGDWVCFRYKGGWHVGRIKEFITRHETGKPRGAVVAMERVRWVAHPYTEDVAVSYSTLRRAGKDEEVA